MPKPKRDPWQWLRDAVAGLVAPVRQDRGPGQTAARNAFERAGMVPPVSPWRMPELPRARATPRSSGPALVTREQARIQAEEVNLRMSGRVRSSRRPRRKPKS